MIVLHTRPKARWLPPSDWTRIVIEGEDETLVANLVTSQLLHTCNEVTVEDPETADAEILNPTENEHDQD